MATPLKLLYNPAYFEQLCPLLKESLPGFDRNDFIFGIFNNDWPDKELKARVRHISRVLHHFLPEDFTEAASQLIKIAHQLEKHFPSQRFENVFLADYVEIFGLDYPDTALRTLEEITKLISAEFALRPFVIRFPDKTMQYLLKWSSSPNPHLRHLSSEGLKTMSALSRIDEIMP